MSLRALTAATLVAAASFAAAPAFAKTQPDQVVVFGDSLVDAGNVFIATGGATPDPAKGYYPGHFTNGRDYTDLLSQRLYAHDSRPALAGGNNYAFGGASILVSNFTVPNLPAQLGLYAAGSAAFGLTGHAVDPKALYVLNFGGNDVFAIESGKVPAATVPAYEAAAVDTLANAIQALDAGGATKILVTGIPNLDAVGIPFDALLQSKLNGLKLTNAALFRFNYLDFFTRLAANPGKLGVPAFTKPGACFDHVAPPAPGVLPDCSGYFTVDGTHPIAPIQAAIFREVAHTTGIGTVPEPAAWSLMIAGFGLVGSATRRRRVATAA